MPRKKRKSLKKYAVKMPNMPPVPEVPGKRWLLSGPPAPPDFEMILTSTPVVARVRKLRVRWTADLEQEAAFYHGR